MQVKWEEPAAFCRAYLRSRGRALTRRQQMLAGLIAAVVVAALILGFEGFFFLLHKKDLGVPAYFYFLAPAIAGIFVGFLPTMASVIPAKIILNEKGLHRHKPFGSEIHIEFWPWESMTELQVENIACGQETFHVLKVRCREESAELLIGLGNADLDAIDQLVRRMGRTLSIRT